MFTINPGTLLGRNVYRNKDTISSFKSIIYETRNCVYNIIRTKCSSISKKRLRITGNIKKKLGTPQNFIRNV